MVYQDPGPDAAAWWIVQYSGSQRSLGSVLWLMTWISRISWGDGGGGCAGCWPLRYGSVAVQTRAKRETRQKEGLGTQGT